MEDDKRILALMENLKCTKDEAIQVIADDLKIDKGEKLFELPDELKAGAKKARQADRAPTVYNFDTSKRERKQDDEKRVIINAIEKMLQSQLMVENLEVTNIEREINFLYNDKKFKVVLSCPRK